MSPRLGDFIPARTHTTPLFQKYSQPRACRQRKRRRDDQGLGISSAANKHIIHIAAVDQTRRKRKKV
jgi:hypothetical protein